MNYTRIRELALEAGYLPDGFGSGHWDMEECKNLVELVVRECAKTLLDSRYENTRSEYYDAFNEALIYGSIKIKHHFGVNE